MKSHGIDQCTLDLDALRTFILGTELGSYRAASMRLGRSQAALSAHLKKLEEQIGKPLVQKSGRGLMLTSAGEILFAHGRRILALSDEAIAAAATAGDVGGAVRLGLVHDFAEEWLPRLLQRFSRLHPNVQLEVHADQTSTLIKHLEMGFFDFIIAWGEAEKANAQTIAELPLEWIGPLDGAIRRHEDGAIPLVLGESPSKFRSAAIDALDRAGMPWRLAYTSPSPSGRWSAVAAGFGISVRTRFALPNSVRILSAVETDLPELPTIKLSVYHTGFKPSRAAAYVVSAVQDALTEGVWALPGAGRMGALAR